MIWGKKFNFSVSFYLYVMRNKNNLSCVIIIEKLREVDIECKTNEKKKKKTFFHSWKGKQGKSHCPESLKFTEGIERSPPHSPPK